MRQRSEPPAQVVILGAGRGVRGGRPSVMVDIDEHGRVMDWLLSAFEVLGDPELSFVAGYGADDVIERYPEVRPVFNRDWDHTGPVSSLGLVEPDTTRPLFVSYADVVFRASAVEALRDAPGDVVIALDTTWRARYDGRSRSDLEVAEKVSVDGDLLSAVGRSVATDTADAEFAGLLRLSGAAADSAFAAIRSGGFEPRAGLPELITHLIDAGHAVGFVDLHGEWAELDAKQDLARFVLGTKAESLARLRNMSHGGEIGELVSFTSEEWKRDRDGIIAEILEVIPGRRLIVRSSALTEDSWFESAAGRYESILDVERSDEAVSQAVDDVFASYGEVGGDDQVLVQSMLVDVALSGVVMTRTHALSAPYYVINFDDSTSRTDTVTGGGDVRSVFLHRDAVLRSGLPAQLGPLLAMVQNIEKLVGHDSLDIEFAVTGDDRVHILQVRPIAVSGEPTPIDDERVALALSEAQRFLAARTATPPNLVGSSTRYSVMADWNPAEIVGTKPKQLALSLYRYLITDETWATQRAEYGYRDVRPCPLLVDVVGHPFVDVRASFCSFVPATLEDDLAGRLVDHYLDRLAAEPNLHDKVEFDVLFTCTTADIDDRLGRLSDSGFADSEVDALRSALEDLTVAGIDRLDDDLAELDVVGARIDAIDACELAPLDRAYHYLEIARRQGTLVFSHLARAGFVATALLRSLRTVGALEDQQVGAFLASVETVLGQMQSDAAAVRAGDLGWDAFVGRYGHLRPGTYDITSPAYSTDAEQYLRPVVEGAAAAVQGPGNRDGYWSPTSRAAVTEALASCGLACDADRFEHFARTAIAGREEGKFVFTRALSNALECVAAHGATLGLSRSDLAHISIADLLACRDVISEAGQMLHGRSLEGRERFGVSQGVCLPGQIATSEDLTCFEQEAAEPNFVTQQVVQAPAIAGAIQPGVDVDGRIVLIPSADPGFDWLLARDIVGLITMYGGANSHMAVRAAEIGLPAAVGVGELRFDLLADAGSIRLDCVSRTITVTH